MLLGLILLRRWILSVMTNFTVSMMVSEFFPFSENLEYKFQVFKLGLPSLRYNP